MPTVLEAPETVQETTWQRDHDEERIGFSKAILALAPPERNPQKPPWDTPATMWRVFFTPRRSVGW